MPKTYELEVETWTPDTHSTAWAFRNYNRGKRRIVGLQAAQREARRIWGTRSATFAVHVIIRDVATGNRRLPWGRVLSGKA